MKRRITSIVLVMTIVLHLLSQMTLIVSAAPQPDGVLSVARSWLGSTYYDGYCQAFVWRCFKDANVINASASSATEARKKWMISSDRTNIPIGAAIYFTSSSIHGHVGIYTGNGKMVHAVSKVREEVISDAWWKRYQGWGWHGGVALEKSSSVSGKQTCTSHTYDNMGNCTRCNEKYKISITSMSDTYYAVKDKVPLRANPYAPDTILRTLSKGEAVTVTGSGENSVGNLWYRINDKGNVRWVYSKNVEKPSSSILSAPTGLIAKKASDTSAKVSWNTVSGATSYEMQYKSLKSSNIWLDYKNINISSYTVAGMENDRTYSFRVRAVNDRGVSNWSPELTYIHQGKPSATGSQSVLTVKNALKDNFTVTIPANTTVYGFSSPTSSTRLTLYTPKTESFNLYCSERLDMSDGTTRYFFRSGGSTSKDYYLMFTDSMAVSDSSMVKRYTVRYDANGGSGAPEDQEFADASKIILSSTKPVKSGYEFMGWSITGTSGGTLYAPGSTYNLEKDTRFYAMWKDTRICTLNYDANGGIGAPPRQREIYMELWTISQITPTREGYAFVGWSESPEAYYAMWEPNQTFRAKDDMTIYAIWRKIPEVSVELATLDVYYFNAGWIDTAVMSLGGTGSDRKHQHDVFFGVEYKIKSSKAINNYGIEIFDNQKRLLHTIVKKPKTIAETWISEKTGIHKLSYISHEGKIGNITHTPLYPPLQLQKDNTYYWRVYFICDGQRVEADMQSFVFTIEEGYY